MSLGGLGLGVGHGHAYAVTSSILGLSLGSVLLVAGGVALVAVGLRKLRRSSREKTEAEKA